MDRSGECQQISLKDLNVNRELNFVGFTPQMFLEVSHFVSAGRMVLHTSRMVLHTDRPPGPCACCGRLIPDLRSQMCILAGCDFVRALPGIGIKKAHQHIRRLRSFVRVRLHSATSCHVYTPMLLAHDSLRWRYACPTQSETAH